MLQINYPFRQNLLSILCLSVILINLSCTNPQRCEPLSHLIEKDVLPEVADNLRVDIYLDATLSMQGFTKSDSFSYYQQTIPLLESAVIKTWKNGLVNFNKFGAEIEPLAGRRFLEANKAEFYSDKNYNRKTLIENVIETSVTQNLSIIVTDLFQDNADVNQLIEKIKGKFISNGSAVGVMAIKSQFNGTIFDIGSNNYTFPYKTLDDTTLRPFYILAFGSHPDITAYFDTLENSGLKDFPVKERIVFSRFLTAKPATFHNSKIIDNKNINDVSGVLVKGDSAATEFKELKIVNKAKESTFKVQLPFKRLSNTVNFGNNLETEIQTSTCRKVDNAASNQANALSFASNPNIQNALTVSAALDTSAEFIELNLTVNPGKFDSADVSGFHIILRPKEYLLPKWIDDWNMTDGQIESWKNSPASFEGTKTYNLKRFMQDLWGTTQKSHQPKVADFYCYIKPD